MHVLTCCLRDGTPLRLQEPINSLYLSWKLQSLIGTTTDRSLVYPKRTGLSCCIISEDLLLAAAAARIDLSSAFSKCSPMGLHLGSHRQNLLTTPQVMRGLAVVLLEQLIDGSRHDPRHPILAACFPYAALTRVPDPSMRGHKTTNSFLML